MGLAICVVLLADVFLRDDQRDVGIARRDGDRETERAERVRVKALNGDGQPHTVEAEGLLAVCIQHEMDHLMGKVFVEYLSPLKRNRIKTKLLKAERDLQQEQGH